jgi:membrane-associated phospholipid phosphatase
MTQVNSKSQRPFPRFIPSLHIGKRVIILAVFLSTLVLDLVSTADARPSVQSDLVLRWNQAINDSILATRATPPISSRAFAITHTCIFDAWAAYSDTAAGTQLGTSLRQDKAERTSANREKAISYAAYRALSDLFPSQKPTLLDPLMESLGYDSREISTDVSTPSGIGNAAAQAVLDLRHQDRSNQLGDLHPGPYSDYTGYTPANRTGMLDNPDRWQPLINNGVAQSWQVPHWGLVAPFALTSGAQLRSYALARGPYAYPSSSYWKQALDIIELSAHLGDREKVIAEYWADGPATVTPPGHWNAIARSISRRDKQSLDQAVEMFFVLGNALMDAGIAAWDTKRYTDSVRPVTVIRGLMGNRKIVAWAGPGLGTKVIDCKNFRSYLPTPPFPSYVSGHSAFSAAAAEILKRFTGSDAFGQSFTVEPGSSIIERGLTPRVPVVLVWATFSEAADEAGMSRRYGGIHFESDDVAGRALGRLAAEEVWNKSITYFRPNGF